MSVELIDTSRASRIVLQELPALISPETMGETRNDDLDPGYLCLICQVEGQLTVWDLGGKSGTFINGSRVTHATLSESDTLRLGASEFRVHTNHSKRYLHGVRT